MTLLDGFASTLKNKPGNTINGMTK